MYIMEGYAHVLYAYMGESSKFPKSWTLEIHI